jgi:hypothetical protein
VVLKDVSNRVNLLFLIEFLVFLIKNFVNVQDLDQYLYYHNHDLSHHLEKQWLLKIEFVFEATKKFIVRKKKDFFFSFCFTCKAANVIISSSVQSISSLKIDHLACSYN